MCHVLVTKKLVLGCGFEQVTLSLAAKRFQTSIPLCRETFFSSAMDDHLVQRYILISTFES